MNVLIVESVFEQGTTHTYSLGFVFFNISNNFIVILNSGARKTHVGLAHPKETELDDIPPSVPMPSIIDQKSIPLSIPISADLINRALDTLTAEGKPIIGTIKLKSVLDRSACIHILECF